jgi:hypothetical protein
VILSAHKQCQAQHIARHFSFYSKLSVARQKGVQTECKAASLSHRLPVSLIRAKAFHALTPHTRELQITDVFLCTCRCVLYQ